MDDLAAKVKEAIDADEGVCPGCFKLMGWEAYVMHVWKGECPTPESCDDTTCPVHYGKLGDPIPDPPVVPPGFLMFVTSSRESQDS